MACLRCVPRDVFVSTNIPISAAAAAAEVEAEHFASVVNFD